MRFVSVWYNNKYTLLIMVRSKQTYYGSCFVASYNATIEKKKLTHSLQKGPIKFQWHGPMGPYLIIPRKYPASDGTRYRSDGDFDRFWQFLANYSRCRNAFFLNTCSIGAFMFTNTWRHFQTCARTGWQKEPTWSAFARKTCSTFQPRHWSTRRNTLIF